MSVCVYVCVRERYCLLSEVRDDSSLFTDMAVFLISDEDDTTVHEYTPNQDKPTPHKIRHYTNSVSWNRNSFFGLKKKKNSRQTVRSSHRNRGQTEKEISESTSASAVICCLWFTIPFLSVKAENLIPLSGGVTQSLSFWDEKKERKN